MYNYNYYYVTGKTGTIEWICRLYITCKNFTRECNMILLGIRDRTDGNIPNIVKQMRCNSLRDICIIGDISLIEEGIDRGLCDWNHGLYGACMGGHLDIVNLMIKKGAYDWSSGMHGACEGGNIAILELMIQKGADLHPMCLAYACRSGNKDLVDFIIRNIHIDYSWFGWYKFLYEACYGENKKIVDLILQIGNGQFDFNKAICGAYESGNKDMVEYLVEKGASPVKGHLWNTLDCKHWPLAEYIIMTEAYLYPDEDEDLEEDEYHCIIKEFPDYLKYLATKLNKSKPSTNGLYNVLDDLVSLY